MLLAVGAECSLFMVPIPSKNEGTHVFVCMCVQVTISTAPCSCDLAKLNKDCYKEMSETRLLILTS